jgi:hypothetical protein
MKLSEISQEQQKKMLLIVLSAVFVTAVVLFSATHLITKNKAQRAILSDLYEKIAATDSNSSIKKCADNFTKKNIAVSTAINTSIAPEKNRFVWVTSLIYEYAREAGFDITNFDEASTQEPAWAATPVPAKDGVVAKERVFVPYQILLRFECSYFKLLHFVRLVEEHNKYASIQSLSINSQKSTPNQHSISMTIEWPTVKAAAKDKIDAVIAEKATTKLSKGAGEK